MRTRAIAILVVIFGGLAAAVVPRLGAEGAATKGDEVSTVRESDANASVLARIHAEKRRRIEKQWAEASEALTSSALAEGEEPGSPKPASLSTIDGAIVAEAPRANPVQITPAESGSQKLESFSTIEIGPSELSPSERAKAGIR